jgi:membrane protease subunit HflK
VIANAQGDASRFKQILAEYERAPAVTRERMYLDAMQQILSSTSKILVDKGAAEKSLIYLPIDKLMQLSNAQPASAAVNVPDTAVHPGAQQDNTLSSSTATDVTASRRDLLRSRERETR